MDLPRRALLVYNPASTAAVPGSWLGPVVHRLCEETDRIVEVRATRPGLTGKELLSTISEDCNLVIAAGGDGTIQLVVGAMAEARLNLPLAILPVGTGNQLARNLNIYRDNLLTDPLDRAIRTIIHGRVASIDLGIMNGHYFTVGAGAGPMSDAVISPGREDKTNWKMLAYASSMIQTFAMPPVVFRVTADGERFEITASGIFVTNVSDLGVGTISETADINDGLLDLCILNPTKFTDYLELGFRFGGGFVGGEAPYYIRKVKVVDIEVIPVHSPLSPFQRFGHKVRSWLQGRPDSPAPIHREVTAMIDGDACGTTPMHIEIAPNAVQVLLPNDQD